MDDLSGKWWRPAELISACEPIRLRVSSRDFRHGNVMKPVREAIAAARFAELLPWNRDWEVRLASPKGEDFPDFRLRSGAEESLFELVEARYPDLDQNDTIPGWRDEDPDEHSKAGMAIVAKRIASKAAKGYRPKPHLLVYCNFWNCEVLGHEADKIIAPCRESFLSVWLLFVKEEAIQLWPSPCKIKAQSG